MSTSEMSKPQPAGGQAQRLPGATRDISLHDQLYRYAEDLQHMIERQGSLEEDYEKLNETCVRLEESRAILDEVIRYTRDIYVITDTSGTILQCNPAAAAICPDWVGEQFESRLLPDFFDNYLRLRDHSLGMRSDGKDELELRFRRAHTKPGPIAPLIVMAQVVAITKQDGQSHLNWVMRDITAQREAEFESQISSMVFNSATEGVMITDVAGEILAVNPAFTRITGYSAEEVVGRNPRMLNSGVQDAAFYQAFWRSLHEKGTWQGEVYNRKKNGEIYPEWLTVNAVKDTDGKTLTYLGVFSDLSRLLQAEKRLTYLAHHDTLTGLPNRLLFQDRLSQTITQARRSGQVFTVIFIDLDRFKQINDTHGHAIGDLVLQEAGRRLTATFREADTVARLGGDEFVILAPMLAGSQDIARVCEKAIAALIQPIRADDLELTIGGSFGCAQYPEHGEDEASLLKHADAAMYRAKAAGGNTHVIHAGQADATGQPTDLP